MSLQNPTMQSGHRPNIEALEATGDVSGLIRALDFKADPAIRFWAAVALGRLCDPQAFQSLVELMGDPAALPRRGAAMAIGQLADHSAVPVLVSALQDLDPEVRKSAAQALGQLGDPSATTPLLDALEDESWLVRSCVAEALGRLGDPQVVTPLIAALDDPEEIVRHRAARALAMLDTPESRAALTRFQSGAHGGPARSRDLLGYPLGAGAALLLETAVDELVVLIDCETGRIPADDRSVRRARAIASDLYNAGGHSLMEQAVVLLRTRRPLWHELVVAWWDGIGDWVY